MRHDYLYAPYLTDAMHWFCKPDPARRIHHLHLVPAGSKRYREELAFRDLLRAHPEVAEEYTALKRSLADRFRYNREAYTNAKKEFIVTKLAHSGSGVASIRPSSTALRRDS